MTWLMAAPNEASVSSDRQRQTEQIGLRVGDLGVFEAEIGILAVMGFFVKH